MKTLLLVTDLTIWSMGQGKGGPAFTQTIKRYKAEGWNVVVLSDVPSNSDYKGLEAENNVIIRPSIFKKAIMFRKIGFVFRFLDHAVATQRFVNAINKLINHNSDQCVLYAYEIFGVRACSIVSKRRRLPLVTRFQGTVLSQYELSFFNRVRLYPHCQALSERADLIIMTDDGTRGEAVLKSLGNESNLLFLKNGLDLMRADVYEAVKQVSVEEARRRLFCVAEKSECIFLTVSRLESWKRVDRAIKGFAEYLQLGGIGRLVIVGEGSASQELKTLALDLGVGDFVLFVGAVSHDAVYEYMHACDVFLSLYDLSNVGNPLLEAMALGKCIVALDTGDTGEVVQDGVNGVLLHSSESRALGKIMKQLAYDTELRLSLGDCARQYAENNLLSWEERMGIECNTVSALVCN